MSFRFFIFLFFTFILLSIFIFFSFSREEKVLQGTNSLETALSYKTGLLLKKLINSRKDSLVSKTRFYSRKDAVFESSHDSSKRDFFLTNTLYDEVLSQERFSLFIWLDSQSNVLVAKYWDENIFHYIPVPQSLHFLYQAGGPLNPDPYISLSGYTLLLDQPALFSSEPIINHNSPNSPAGRLIIFTNLGRRATYDLTELLGSRINYLKIHHPEDELSNNKSDLLIKQISDSSYRIIFTPKPTSSLPIFAVITNLTTNFSQESGKSFDSFIYGLSILFFLVIFFSYLFSEFFIFHPISRLNLFLQEILQRNHFSSLLPESGFGIFFIFSKQINKLLIRLNSSLISQDNLQSTLQRRIHMEELTLKLISLFRSKDSSDLNDYFLSFGTFLSIDFLGYYDFSIHLDKMRCLFFSRDSSNSFSFNSDFCTSLSPWLFSLASSGEDIFIDKLSSAEIICPELCIFLREHNLNSSLLIPLFSSNGKLSGLLLLGNYSTLRTWSELDIKSLLSQGTLLSENF